MVIPPTSNSIILVLERINKVDPAKQPIDPKNANLRENYILSMDLRNCFICTIFENRLGTAITATASFASKNIVKTGMAITGLPAPVAPLTRPPKAKAKNKISMLEGSRFISCI